LSGLQTADTAKTSFNKEYKATALAKDFAAGGLKMGWMPWAADLDALKTNARCSAGAIVAQGQTTISITGQPIGSALKRPALRVEVRSGQISLLYVCLVHLTSGNEAKAGEQKAALLAATAALGMKGVPTAIVGDFNIDLKTAGDLGLGKGWKLLRSNQTTQKSGGELDFGLLAYPSSAFRNASCKVAANSAFAVSDHCVLEFDLPN
jgi:endonuclease/exonuclease/phosphatase family metal-dependent hydrolase